MALPSPFRFRLNCIDHYQATPTALDPQPHRQKNVEQKNAPTVPVIRVFGATETGQKVCAHIHGAFPYLFLPYEGSLAERTVGEYARNLTASINHALALSYRRNPYDQANGVFVAHVSLVKGIPFFGYHIGYKAFFKVYLLNPLNMNRLADLLIQGAVLSQVIQPHESHMQYLAQWMCDYNLFGCSYIDCEQVRFRTPLPSYDDASSAKDRWHIGNVRSEWQSDETDFQRQSHCTLEVDICVQHILNRKEIQSRDIHHDFMERFRDLAAGEKFVHSMAGLWRDETIRRKKKMGLKDPGSSPFPVEVMVSMSADVRAQKSDWIHEEEYREQVRTLIQQERQAMSGRHMQFDNFLDSQSELAKLPSAFEAVEELYPGQLLQTAEATSGEDTTFEQPKVLVNESSISQVPDHIDDGYHSDEEAAKELFMSQQAELAEPSKKPRKSLQQAKDVLTSAPDHHSNENEPRLPNGHTPPVDHLSVTVKRKLAAATTPDQVQSPVIKRPKLSEDGGEADGISRSTVSSIKQKPVGDKLTTPRKVTFQEPLAASQNGPPTSSQLSQGSIKAQGLKGPSTLSFPVVKNPHEPEVELRLSQREGLSNAKNITTPIEKNRHDLPSKDLTATPNTVLKSASTEYSPGLMRIPPILLRMCAHMAKSFKMPTNARAFCYADLPPTTDELDETWTQFDSPSVVYQDAYYSDEQDVPERPREYAGREFKLESNTIPYLPDFDPTGTSPALAGEKLAVTRDKSKEELYYTRKAEACTMRHWQILDAPPSCDEVKRWLKSDRVRPAIDRHDSDDLSLLDMKVADKANLSQLDGPTQKNKHGFKISQKLKATSVEHETQYMTLMSLEVHVNTRGHLVPDPAEDEIACIVWGIQADVKTSNAQYETGILVLSDSSGVASEIARSTLATVEVEEDELDLLNRIVDIVRDLDPDILTGYEVHNGSWGYLIERARVKYEFDLCDELSRMKSQSHGRFGKEADRWGFTTTSTIRVTGRHMINIWRAMRGELNLLQYTMENVAFHLLHKRIPHYNFAELTAWYRSGRSRAIAKTIKYFLARVQVNLQILEANELIPRTSEQARLLGVDFFSVFSRGSQFKVESIMFRIAKPENFVLVSPSRKQVGQQNALECLPLVMEPQSAFYPSPLLVLDFQSLYPSVMIAYNYCYSTFLGRVVSWRGTNKMGFTDFKREPRLLELVKEHVNIAPNGIMYVKPEMRKSLLAKMLGEILETRVMVKSGMKQDKDDKTLQQLLNNRQLALKLLANVTYGYTSASFSGRMPCSEIADSIVQTGRETLEKAIAMIHSVEKWGAEVVYGDTDSLFVYLKGRTREQAFNIGEEIAEAITNANPRPIKLKFEKIYHPCVLLAKKRYVGFKYEHRKQTEPDFDAKGIETVRRDGTPADQKIEERALKLLFRTADLTQVKSYFQAQCTKIMSGKVSIQDFLFAKEVKLGTYADRGPPPPGALIATRKMLQDARQEPQYGERVPYVVITGAPGARLIDRCVDPERLLKDDQLELDAEYYITKNIIPPLERIFNLVGANVRAWYDEMPKVQRIRSVKATAQLLADGAGPSKKTLESYLQATTCVVCRAKLPPQQPPVDAATDLLPPVPVCEECMSQPELVFASLKFREMKAARRVQNVHDICRSCSGLSNGEEVRCDSRDCPVYYTRTKEESSLESLKQRFKPVIQVLQDEPQSETLQW